MSISIDDIKKLRKETGAGVLAVKEALEDAGGDFEVAKKDLIAQGIAKAEKKSARDASEGLVHAYIHMGGKLGSMVLVACETDFVARTDDFKKLCNELAMQVCTDDYADVEALLNDEYMRDSTKTVRDVVTESIAKLGENIEIRKFTKLSVC
jgi:elongation factor Ts